VSGTFFVFTNSLDRGNHLTWDNVKEMLKDGMEIGSHTKTHPFLNDIKDSEQLKNEIEGSKKILESELGVTIESFANPFGEHSTTTVQTVEDAGYRVARSLLMKAGGNMQSKDNRYTLSAFLVTDSLADFERKVSK